MRRDIEVWLLQSERDYANAKKNFTAKEYYLTAFLVQQAVEKALKAYYLYKKETFADKTHSLTYLGKEVGLPPKLLTHVRKINPDFILTRYPDMQGVPPYEAYDQDIAEERLEQGKEVLAWIKNNLPS
jgi:HEPN domain-containing protein